MLALGAGGPRSARREGVPVRGVTIVGALAAAGLAACGTSSAGTGPVTLNFYNFPDHSGAVQRAVEQLQQARAAASTGSSTTSCRTRPTSSGCRWCGGWPPGTARWTSSGWTSPGRPSSPRRAGSGRGPASTRRQATGHAQGAAADRHLARQAGRGPVQQQHPAALVPLRPGEDPAEDVGADDRRRGAARQAGQAAPHRDPGRPVRGHRRCGSTRWWPVRAAAS